MQTIQKALETILGAYHEEAPESAVFPYKVFSCKRMNEDDHLETWQIEVNVWDKHKYYSRANDVMDDLESDIHEKGILENGYLIQFWKGQRQNVLDEDKQIKRVREVFEAHIIER